MKPTSRSGERKPLKHFVAWAVLARYAMVKMRATTGGGVLVVALICLLLAPAPAPAEASRTLLKSKEGALKATANWLGGAGVFRRPNAPAASNKANAAPGGVLGEAEGGATAAPSAPAEEWKRGEGVEIVKGGPKASPFQAEVLEALLGGAEVSALFHDTHNRIAHVDGMFKVLASRSAPRALCHIFPRFIKPAIPRRK